MTGGTTPSLTLCGHESPFPGGEPCPKEQGHADGHVYWTQTRPGNHRRRNGVWIVDADGKTLMHATFEGGTDAETICALLAIGDAAAKRLTEDSA